MNDELYKEFKNTRSTYGLWPSSAANRLRMAKGILLQRVKDALRSTDDIRHPRRIDAMITRVGNEEVCTIKGYSCDAKLESDIVDGLDDDIDGFTMSRNVNPYREDGWGHDGMDRGLYVLNSDTLVSFNETRLDVIKNAPSMSKQMKYEWATEFMKRKLERAKEKIEGDVFLVGVIIECEELGIYEALWGIELSGDDKLDNSYVQEVVEDLCGQVEYEIDRQKKVA